MFKIPLHHVVQASRQSPEIVFQSHLCVCVIIN